MRPQKPKYALLERRTSPYLALSLEPDDHLAFWHAYNQPDERRRTLYISNSAGDTVFALFKLTTEQLAALHALIGEELQKPDELTKERFPWYDPTPFPFPFLASGEGAPFDDAPRKEATGERESA